MKFAKFYYEKEIHYGVVDNDKVNLIKGDIYSTWNYTDEIVRFDQIDILAPVVPNKIIGIGANYVGHKDELPSVLPQIPIFFLKPTSTIIGPEKEIIIPDSIHEVKFESELVVVIGKKTKNVSKENAFDYVFGYTIGNDVTAPQFFHKDGHWTLGKAFDTFTPIGPFIETELDPFNVYVTTRVNKEEKQNGSTELMIVPVHEMISYLSEVMTLQAGDIILTGTPFGAEFVQEGDVIESGIDGIGLLKNKVVKH